MGIETRMRATEQRIAEANGLALTERWIDVTSPSVRVRVLEAGEGDPVLFVNGISAPGIGLAPLAGRLPGHRHLLVDLPGHGLSPPYSWEGPPVREQAVAVLTAVLDGLDVDQVTLVGNSLGGLFTLWFALDRPDRVRQAVIVGQPAVAIPGAKGNLTMGMLTAPVVGAVVTWMSRLPAPRFSARLVLREAAGAAAAKAISSDLVDMHSLPMRLPGQAASFRSLLRRLLDGRDPRPEHVLTDDELRSFTVPLLFVWPDDDVFLPAARGKPSVDKIPTATFVTMPGGHFPWYDDAELCASLVAPALASPSGG